jgi:hypothetical protein
MKWNSVVLWAVSVLYTIFTEKRKLKAQHFVVKTYLITFRKYEYRCDYLNMNFLFQNLDFSRMRVHS